MHVLHLSDQMKSVMTVLRSKDVDREDFVFYADRIVRFVVEEGLAHLPCMDSPSRGCRLIIGNNRYRHHDSHADNG